VAFGEVPNVGCGARVSINELWRRVRTLVGTTVEARHEPSRASDVRDSLASLDRSSSVLGYAPSVSLEDGLRAAVRALATAAVH
jgi:nucleoside-diphosphate-sugar epimerase